MFDRVMSKIVGVALVAAFGATGWVLIADPAGANNCPSNSTPQPCPTTTTTKPKPPETTTTVTVPETTVPEIETTTTFETIPPVVMTRPKFTG